MNDRQKKVLLGVYRNREHYARQERPTGKSTSQRTTLWCRTQDCQSGFVQVNPSIWLGESMTPSLHVMVGRTYRQLEAKGLLERVAWGYDKARTTHLRLTAAGEKLARELEATPDA